MCMGCYLFFYLGWAAQEADGGADPHLRQGLCLLAPRATLCSLSCHFPSRTAWTPYFIATFVK